VNTVAASGIAAKTSGPVEEDEEEGPFNKKAQTRQHGAESWEERPKFHLLLRDLF
jgi:hypothetical protein